MLYFSYPSIRILHTQAVEISVLQQEVLFPRKCRGEKTDSDCLRTPLQGEPPKSMEFHNIFPGDNSFGSVLATVIVNKQLGISSCQIAPLVA